ncbi:hypothetical protein ABB37_09302 [Leptomonas pyrrhocoris]|uniref:Uncharacterized protein n=1 Tax=Leptomonas pyrrhocoris TaxID=157538 RepID=A0A0N0DRD8_LEPPY|nr:hypothetical protein ABB37_09302 [Leptomonas pyrrhocoris]KPA74311.1 hypothetical protein ABB37_09302 [Leptomonas pyrrhocoris]|eukprot:XP_015652750.1 hypothetical protein ABB37_09302 [Leptomonas pyrrhocoris]
MYAGFPKLPVTEAQPAVDEEKEKFDESGCVMCTEFPLPKTVQLSFPAVCALLYNARSATSSQNIFGDVIGLQIGDAVSITDVRFQPRIDVEEEDRMSQEEFTERLRKERELLRNDMNIHEAAYSDEFLDTNAIGQFVVCSARFNPYSKRTMDKLRDLHDQSQPAILLIYDPFRTSLLGRPYIRAFTPTEAYYKYDVLVSKERSYQRRRGLAGYAKESGITKHGALHEIPVKLDVDAFHKLNLLHIHTNPVTDTFKAIESLAVGNYIEALLSSIRSNTEQLKSNLDKEGNAKDNGNVPVGQDAETMLLMKHLREQTDHLDALCDSELLYSSLLRDL